MFHRKEIEGKSVVSFKTPDSIHKLALWHCDRLQPLQSTFMMEPHGKALLYRTMDDVEAVRTTLQRGVYMVWGLFQFETSGAAPIRFDQDALDAFEVKLSKSGGTLIRGESTTQHDLYRVRDFRVKKPGGYFRVQPSLIMASVQITDPDQFAESCCSSWGRRGGYGSGMVFFKGANNG